MTEAGGPEQDWIGRNVLGGALTQGAIIIVNFTMRALKEILMWENDNDCTFYSPFNGFLRSLDCINVSSSHFLCARECLE